MNEQFIRIFHALAGSIGSQPARLSVALSLAFTLKGAVQMLHAFYDTNTIISNINSIEIIYYIAVSFFFIFFPTIITSKNDKFERDIEIINKALADKNLADDQKRILTRNLLSIYLRKTRAIRESISKEGSEK